MPSSRLSSTPEYPAALRPASRWWPPACYHPISPIQPSNPSRLLNHKTLTYLETKHSRPSLVEALHKTNVEIRAGTTQRQVHESVRPRMAAVEDNGAAVERPGGAVGGVGGCVDIGAGVLPLGCGCGEGVCAPGRCEEFEVGCCGAGQRKSQ
jgi:hypothetical protein